MVITDTVGFIRDLPKDLFAAFRATFEEAADADLLLHVVDATDPAKEQHMETTERILAELSLNAILRLLIFNKADLMEPAEAEQLRKRYPDALLIAAVERETTRALLDRIAALLSDRWAESAVYPKAAETDAASENGDGHEMTTIEQMVGKSRRRRSLAHIRA